MGQVVFILFEPHLTLTSLGKLLELTKSPDVYFFEASFFRPILLTTMKAVLKETK